MPIRYRMLNAPAKGTGAFMPAPTTTPAASSGGEQIRIGYPGNLPIPSSPPPGISGVNYCSPASVAGWANDDFQPDTTSPPPGGKTQQMAFAGPATPFLPTIYYTKPTFMGPMHGLGAAGMKIYSDNVIPMPAEQPGYVAKVGFTPPPRLGGRSVTAWPAPFTQWPAYGGGTG
jgi:hypothetical protein